MPPPDPKDLAVTSISTIGRRVQRLRLAREISQLELAQSTGIATGVVSMIENGRQAPTPQQLESIASALDCRIDYFTRNSPELATGKPWLRAYADAPKRTVDCYVADSEAAVDAIDTLGLDVLPDRIPSFHESLEDDEAIEEFADFVRVAAEIPEEGPVNDSIRAVERLGCIVLPMDSELGRHMGLSLRINAKPLIRVSRSVALPDGTALPSGDRQRFTVAHELGHLALHAAQPPPATADEATRIERQAHRFAGAFLAPADPLLQSLDDVGGRVTLSTLQRLKSIWGVSIKMLVVRMQQLSRIDTYQARSLYKQISARRWNTVEPVEVEREHAIWLERAIAKAGRTGPPHRSPLDIACERSDLGSSYFIRWTDWSVQPPSGDILELPVRDDRRCDGEQAGPARVLPIRRR